MVRIASRYCRKCQRQTAAIRSGANHVLHLLLTVFTAGLWLPVWILSSLGGSWRCQTCGSRTSAGTFAQTAGGFAVFALLVIGAITYFAVHSGGHSPVAREISPPPASPKSPKPAIAVAAAIKIVEADPEAAARKRFSTKLANARALIKAGVLPPARKSLQEIIDTAPATAIAAEAQQELDSLPAR